MESEKLKSKLRLSGFCCFSLRIGTLIVAHIQLFYSIIVLQTEILEVLVPEYVTRTVAGVGVLLAVLSIVGWCYLIKGFRQV